MGNELNMEIDIDEETAKAIVDNVSVAMGEGCGSQKADHFVMKIFVKFPEIRKEYQWMEKHLKLD